MKKQEKKKKTKYRLPLEAVLSIRRHSIETRKGKKGYDRKRLKQQNNEIAGEHFTKENN